MRRSLVEFTAPSANGDTIQPLKPAPEKPTPRPLRLEALPASPRKALAEQLTRAKAKRRGARRTREERKPAPIAATHAPVVAGAVRSDSGFARVLADASAIAAKAAQDYRGWLMEHMKSNISGALGYASGIASTNLAATPGARAADAGVESASPDASTAEKNRAHAADPAKSCAQVFEAMTANVNATLEFAQRLSEVKSAAELVRLSTSQTRKQIELMMAQAAALGKLSQSTATNIAAKQPRKK